MSLLDSNFYAGSEYFIDEKVGMFKLTNSYKIYNASGNQVGAINQKRTGGGGLLQFVLSKKMLPFKLNVVDSQGQVQATICRGWSFWMSKIKIEDSNGNSIGIIKQKFKFFSSLFHLINEQGDQLAQINGDWKAWNFNISNMNGVQLGSITKKWAGLAKEFFTTADKYVVQVHNSKAPKLEKLMVLTVAITIDMVLKESK